MKVSIVMTCYNTSQFVGEAIRSVVNQTYKDWELVIVDDCSTDKTVKIVMKSLRGFVITDRSKVIRHEQNYGVGKSLYDAIDAASGELVAILDSDDVIAPNVLSLVVAPHIADKDISLVYTNYMECGSKLEHRKLVRNFQIPKGKTFLDFMKGVSHFKCFKKSSYMRTVGVNQSLLKSVDKDLVLKLEEVGKLYYVDTIGYFHREHPGNISNSFFSKPREKRVKIRQDRKDIMEHARIRRKLTGGSQ